MREASFLFDFQHIDLHFCTSSDNMAREAYLISEPEHTHTLYSSRKMAVVDAYAVSKARRAFISSND